MYLVAIAWLYVALMMAVAEAMHPAGGVVGALFTFVLYGVAPVALVLYLLGTPMRIRARKAREASAAQVEPASDPAAAVTPDAGLLSGIAPDEGGQAPGAAIAPVRKVP